MKKIYKDGWDPFSSFFQTMGLFVKMIEDFLSVLSDVNDSEKKLSSVIFLDFLVCVIN